MDTDIYYFSGTGNCLYVANEIAKKTNVIPKSITQEIKNKKINTKKKNMIIVFPSYLAPIYGVPLIVETFLNRINMIEEKYIVAICTCGGYESVNAIPPLMRIDKKIKSLGGKLSEDYSIRLPMNNLDYEHIPIPIEKNTEIILSNAQKKIKKIKNVILRKKNQKKRIIEKTFYLSMIPLFKLMEKPVLNELKKYAKEVKSDLNFKELIPLTDRSIELNENCIGCGICIKICPVDNIELINKKPIWKNHCEMCFACDEWCPQNAIHHWSRKIGKKYHHPDVKIEDFITI